MDVLLDANNQIFVLRIADCIIQTLEFARILHEHRGILLARHLRLIYWVIAPTTQLEVIADMIVGGHPALAEVCTKQIHRESSHTIDLQQLSNTWSDIHLMNPCTDKDGTCNCSKSCFNKRKFPLISIQRMWHCSRLDQHDPFLPGYDIYGNNRSKESAANLDFSLPPFACDENDWGKKNFEFQQC